jgi:hypothetical protein
LVSFSTDFIGGGENGYGFSQVYFHVSSNNSLPNGFEYLAAVESFASDGGGDLATSSSKWAPFYVQEGR